MIDGFHGRSKSMRKHELIRALVILLSGCFALAHCAEAQYYVAKTGSDSNSGSASAPWLTPERRRSLTTRRCATQGSEDAASSAFPLQQYQRGPVAGAHAVGDRAASVAQNAASTGTEQ